MSKHAALKKRKTVLNDGIKPLDEAYRLPQAASQGELSTSQIHSTPIWKRVNLSSIPFGKSPLKNKSRSSKMYLSLFFVVLVTSIAVSATTFFLTRRLSVPKKNEIVTLNRPTISVVQPNPAAPPRVPMYKVRIYAVPKSCSPCRVAGILPGGQQVLLISNDSLIWKGIKSKQIFVEGTAQKSADNRTVIRVQKLKES